MKLSELKKRGGFVSAQPVKESVEWVHPDEETGEEVTDTFYVHVRRLAYGVIENILNADPEAPNRSVNAMLISKAVLFGEKPHESMTYEQAYQLEPALARELVGAINRVNKRAGKKKSQPETSSGVS